MFRVEIIGNLGGDAKVVKSQQGEFVSLSVAVNRKYKNRNGDTVEERHWVGVSINWNCHNLMPYLLKGTKVFVAGHARLRTFKDGEGNYQAGIDISADAVELCGGNEPKPF